MIKKQPVLNIETEDLSKFKGRLIIETPDHNTPQSKQTNNSVNPFCISDVIVQEQQLSPNRMTLSHFGAFRTSIVTSNMANSTFSGSIYRADRERMAQKRIDPNEEFFKMTILAFQLKN